MYTVVYPPVHNSVHTCTHLRSKYVLPHPSHSSPTRRIAKKNGPIQVYREDRHRGYLQAIVFYMYLRTALAQHTPNSTELRQRPKGEMAEWSIVAVSKAVELQGSGGSNPSLSAKRLQSDCKMVIREAFKTRVNRCRTWSYNDFSLYAVHRPDGLPLGSNRHQSVKFCYRNCYTNRGVAICVAVTAK